MLQFGDVALHTTDITCRVPRICSVDWRFADGSIALGVVVEMIVIDELLATKPNRLGKGGDFVTKLEQPAFGSPHSHWYREGDSNPHGLSSNGF